MSNRTESDIVRRQLETDQENPAVEIPEIVSELEEKDQTDMATIYNCINHTIDNIFSDPPAQEAQLQVTFNYLSTARESRRLRRA